MGKNIYLISSLINDEKIYKIGITRREVSKRIDDLKTGNPYEFKIESVFFAKKFGNSIESRLHFHFKSKQINREWFSLDIDDIESFIGLCESYYKTFEMIQNENTYIQENKISFK